LTRAHALLFDLDGTLTDNFEGIANCLRYALARLDAPEPDARALRACVGPPLRETLPRLLGSDDAALTARALALYRERFADVGWRENAVYAGIAGALAAAARDDRPMLVCTSKPQHYAEMIVAHFGLADFFAGVYGPTLDGALDDKADLLAHLLAREGLAGAQCRMIGDRRHDVRAARRNGARSIGVLWGYGTRAELEEAGADSIVAAPNELAATLAVVQPASS
jgi:phosphoglycolate phosphatase